MNLLKEYATEIILTFLNMGISWIARSIYAQAKALTMTELLRINRIHYKIAQATGDCLLQR